MTVRPEERGAAEQLLALVLTSGEHLWHNRPGSNVAGVWRPATARHRPSGTPVSPGLFVPAAERLYGNLLRIYELDAELMARFGSYALNNTEWRDLKIACAALLLVQPRAGQPVRDEHGKVAFLDDDFRSVGEAMVLYYAKGSTSMLNPKGVLRIAQLLEQPEIADLNRLAGFGDIGARRAPLGRWPAVAREWLAVRERNLPMLEGLVAAGFKDTIKQIARKSGYKPQSPRFFEVLGWRQKQSASGHRTVGMDGLRLQRRERFDGLDEGEICRRIVDERLGFKEVVGRLPKDVGLTPAIMVALLPSLSDRDLRQLTPTLESLGLLEDAEVRTRWERALQTATDQRALNIAKNVRGREVREKLEESADAAVRAAVAAATADADVHVIFLIDKSGSMEVAIDRSKDALGRILAGFPQEKLHIASFDTNGKVLRPKAATRAAVEHLLKDVKAGGGTNHGAALHALHRDGVRIPDGASLIVIVAGDENGEAPQSFAHTLEQLGYRPAALGLLVSVNARFGRGQTVRGAAGILAVPFTEVDANAFSDPYQVTRVLQTMLEAPVAFGIAGHGWLERVLATPLLEKPM